MTLRMGDFNKLVKAARSSDPVSGLTHKFYRYPARFPPGFARTAIQLFTDPGEIVVDPFMGSGTTLVEARAANRRGVGTDVNKLACFLTRVKTRIYTDDELGAVRKWISNVSSSIHCQMPPERAYEWIERGYLRNLKSPTVWPIRKLLELAVGRLTELGTKREEDLARCILLRTGQWALDCRQQIPSADDFRGKLQTLGHNMCDQARIFRNETLSETKEESNPKDAICHEVPAAEISEHYNLKPPKLILTSPPYPGVHVLYHRWQIKGRRETPAPFWIANCLDGQGESYYTMGGRHKAGRKKYFQTLTKSFTNLAKIADKNTVFITVISFSKPEKQQPKFLNSLSQAGLVEVDPENLSTPLNGRIQRAVPNRRWYNETSPEEISTQTETVLIHRLSR